MVKLTTLSICLCVCIMGCASELKVSSPDIQRVSLPNTFGTKTMLIRGFGQEGGDCIKSEIKTYFEGSGGFSILELPAGINDVELDQYVRRNNIDYIMSGEVNQYKADFNGGDRNITVEYFTAFIITAPIAGIYAATTEWEGYAVVSVKMSVIDARTEETVWSSDDNEGITERGKSFVSKDTIRKALLPVACKNIVTKMLTNFLTSLNPS